MIIIIELFDVLDGEVSRTSGQITRYGAFLDSTIDRFTEGMIFLGLILYYSSKNILVVAIIVIAFIGSYLVSYTRARAEGLDFHNLYWRNIGMLRRKKRLVILVLGCWCIFIPVIGNYMFMLFMGILAIGCNYTTWQRMKYVYDQDRLHKIN